jgi:hypothetical protein
VASAASTSRLRVFLQDRCTVDRRSLALFRVVFGLSLLGSLYDRTRGPNLVAFFTDEGILPLGTLLTHPLRVRSWSLLYAFGTPGEVRVVMLCICFVYAAYVVGWHTRWMQWLVVVILVSLDNRNLLLESNAATVTIIAAVFTALLPLGDRFSIDALRLPRLSDPRVVRGAFGILILQFAAIYMFNALQKSGPTWKDGSAVHWVLWQNRLATPLAGLLRMHEPRWLSPLLTHGTVVIEALIPLLLVFSLQQPWVRRVVILLVFGLHGGIALLMMLGSFSYTMMCFSLLLLGPADWEAVGRALAPRVGERLARATARLEAFFGPRREPAPPSAAGRLWARCSAPLREAAGLVIAAAALVQLLVQNWVVPTPLRVTERPQIVETVVDYLRMGQGWMMFAPDAPRDDGTLVVDGVLANGVHVDPFTGRPPDFDQALHGPLDYGEPWCLYFNGVYGEESSFLWPALRTYIAHLHDRPDARVAAPMNRFDVYWVSNQSPPPGSAQPYDIQRKLLFSSVSVR